MNSVQGMRLNKLLLMERATNQKHWSKKIKDAINAGMSHKGDTTSKYSKIISNVTDVANEMEAQAREYDKET